MNDDVLAELLDDRALLGRTSTAERVADILRTRLMEGGFPPGTRLAEEEIGGALGVSRNTLREAFRLLTHERLLIHQLNRGMFVRVLSVEDLEDVYRVRGLTECAVLRSLGAPPYRLGAVEAAVETGRRAARLRRWCDLGTANMRFHQALVGLAGSPRMDEAMRSVLAELRLVFHVVDDPRRLHEPYLSRNEEILRTLRDGDARTAEQLLTGYLDDSHRRLTEAYAQWLGRPAPTPAPSRSSAASAPPARHAGGAA